MNNYYNKDETMKIREVRPSLSSSSDSLLATIFDFIWRNFFQILITAIVYVVIDYIWSDQFFSELAIAVTIGAVLKHHLRKKRSKKET